MHSFVWLNIWLVVYPPMGSTATDREMSTPPTLHFILLYL